MTTLGVFIIILIILVLLPLMMSIKKTQKEVMTSITKLTNVVDSFNDVVVDKTCDIHNNFKEIITKSIVIDSKQTSIKDMLDTFTKGLEVYHNNTIKAISAIRKTPNKPQRRYKPRKQDNTPTDMQ